MKADAKDLADSGKDLVEVHHADETLEHRDVRAVQRIQGETLPEYREQAGVAGGGTIERSRRATRPWFERRLPRTRVCKGAEW